MKRKPNLPSFFEETIVKRYCEKEECKQEGEFKAPRDRRDLQNYIWLCLEHIRDYNAKWNYYEGMDEVEIEKEKRFDETWQRPTWPFTQKVIRQKIKADIDKSDQIFSSFKAFESLSSTSNFDSVKLTSLEEKALSIIDLSYPFEKQELKKKYLALAKKYHPDANGGSKEAEEYLKKVNQSYEILKKLENLKII